MTGSADAEGLRKYRLIAEIGKGGMADVFLAVVQGPAGFNKLVVIKKTRSELTHDPEFIAMFLDEARLAARLNHPNVVQTHEVGQEGDRYFIAMEYLDGQPLNRIRARASQGFTIPMQVRVLSDVLAGLQHAHDLTDFDGTPLGVVHRDATPQNVFVTYDGLIKVVDFGIAKAVDSSSQTRTGVVKGKVAYMAPEQAKGDAVDRRTDVFAVGVMLWEAIAGRRMWKGVADIVVLNHLATGRIPSIKEVVPDVDDGLAEICAKALAPAIDDRYESAIAMHDALEAWLAARADRPSARDVGKFVAEKFSDDRAKVKGVIETQLRDVRWSGAYPRMTGVDLPKIDPGQVMITPTGNRPIDGKTGSTPLLTPSRSSFTGASVTNADTTLLEPAPPLKPNRPVVLIAVGVVAAIGVVVLGVRFLAPKPPSQVATSATVESAPRAPETAVATAAPDDAVKLTVRVTPSNAKIYLDGALLSAGPFEGKVVRSDKPRKLRAEAKSHTAREETVTLTGDVMVSLSLDKDTGAATPPPPPPPPGARAPATPPPAAATPTPPAPVAAPPPPQPTAAPAAPAHSGARPKRTIDSDSPYAN
ncbi:serine/threonine protein kinase [Minicystis rosea]|nr:serine/threonine protein kinase [Minicystis rosea]